MNTGVDQKSSDRVSRETPQDSSESAEKVPTASLNAAAQSFAELRAYAAHYLAAQGALAKLTLRRVAILVGIVAVGFLVVGAMLVSATVLLLIGAADALGSAFTPPKPWIGQIAIGLVFIGGTIVWTILVLKKFNVTSRRKTIADFEQRRRDEKINLGRDVVERASSANLDA